MSDTVIKVENLSKQYRLGKVGTGSLAHDLNRTWHRVRGKEDPYLKIGEANDRSVKGNSEYVWALQDINFDVKQGEVLGIIGRNGAGKSTLLKILSRTTTPTTGSIKIKGRIASLLEVGTGFHPELSGRENIFLNGAILGMTRQEIKRKFDEIVDFAGVERYIDTPVKRYSSGMYVRLAFGVAAHLEPEILIVDEVLAVGDAEFQKKALGKMKDVSVKDGRTVLFVSHNMGAMNSLCDKGMLLSNGSVNMIATIDTVIAGYLKKDNNLGNVALAVSGKDCEFVKVSILNSARETIKNIDVRSSFNIYFEIHSRIDLPKELEAGFSVFNDYGIKVFYTGIKLSQVFSPDLPAGIYQLLAEIPASFLVPGNYAVNIALHIPNVKVYDNYEGVIAFNIEETGGEHFKYSNKNMGVVYCNNIKWAKI